MIIILTGKHHLLNRSTSSCNVLLISRLLESTRTIVNFHDVSQEEDRLNYHFQQQRSLEHEAINSAITSYGLKQTQKNLPIYSDEDSSSDEQLQFQPSTSSSSFETSNVDQNSSLEDAAINSAINSYGLRKE